jgi:hypothetical protein
MVKHIVSWKLKDFAEGKSKQENLVIIQQMLLSLKKLPMVQELEVGINSKHADSSNFDIVLVVSFSTFDDLNKYQVHPDHKKIAEYIGKVRESRACIDYEY